MKLHLGCGKRDFGKEWTHIDGGNFPHLHSHDIVKLPFDDNTADLIYASHVIEYFDRDKIRDVLTEWKRVLKPGAILRVAVPDFRQIVTLYTQYEPLEKFLGMLYGKMPMGESFIYHKTAYDYNSLKKLLQSLGYKTIKTYDWRKTEHAHIDDHSQAYLPHMDKQFGSLMSLNVEARK